mmetsp:Transcript_12517/g.50290  ORF Transcript_12517/g.50290 Transcript_12517/m.50290 type:complete len:321 (+) Transcript_12517:2329-3291(+)
MAFHRRALKSAEAVAACVAGALSVALHTQPLWPSNVPIQSPVSALRSIGWPSVGGRGYRAVSARFGHAVRGFSNARIVRERRVAPLRNDAEKSWMTTRPWVPHLTLGGADQEDAVVGDAAVLEVVDGARVPVAHERGVRRRHPRCVTLPARALDVSDPRRRSRPALRDTDCSDPNSTLQRGTDARGTRRIGKIWFFAHLLYSTRGGLLRLGHLIHARHQLLVHLAHALVELTRRARLAHPVHVHPRLRQPSPRVRPLRVPRRPLRRPRPTPAHVQARRSVLRERRRVLAPTRRLQRAHALQPRLVRHQKLPARLLEVRGE